MRVADYVMNFLGEKSLNEIFVITGRGILFLTDALARNKNLKPVFMHNEQALAYAAYSYAKVSESSSVVLVSTGCASTNCVTGVLNAWQDHIPVIFISGNNPLNENTRYTKFPIRSYGSQEADIVSIIEPITKYAVMVTEAEKICYEMEKAFYMANEGIKGPVWIDLPLDIQDKRVEIDSLVHFYPPQISEKTCSMSDIDYIVDSLSVSDRPVCLIGQGIKAAGSCSEFFDFVEKNNIPVMYSPSAVDVYPSTFRLSIGCVSSLGGSREANFAIQNSDLLLVFGCRLPSIITGGKYDNFAQSAKKIVVDIDEYEPLKGNIVYDRIVNADIKYVLSQLNKRSMKLVSDEWVNKCRHWKNILSLTQIDYNSESLVDLYNLAGYLSKFLKNESILIVDAGLEELIIPSNVKLNETHKCVHPFMQGTMGFALPAVVGAYFSPKYHRDIVAVIGDGSMMMNLQELQTISSYGISAKILIVNNDMYAIIRKRQNDLFKTRTIGTDSSNGIKSPDWDKVANCFGFKYIKIWNNGELLEKLPAIFEMDGCIICEIMCIPDQVYLHSSLAKNSKGVLERRPMEDQAPFLDRDLLNREMLWQR